MLFPPQNKKAFTLLEILLVVAIMILVSVAALSSITKSQDQFRFKAVQSDSLNLLRGIRNNAISNKMVVKTQTPTNPKCTEQGTPDSIPAQYGAKIDATTITIFAEKVGSASGTLNTFDSTDCLFESVYTLSESTIQIFDGKPLETSSPISTPLVIFYQPTSADFKIATSTISKSFVTIKITDGKDSTRISYIVLFKESGNPEQFDTLSSL